MNMKKKQINKKIIFYIALVLFFYLVSKFNIGYNDIRLYFLLIGVAIALIISFDGIRAVLHKKPHILQGWEYVTVGLKLK